jgi:hypothetical protein
MWPPTPAEYQAYLKDSSYVPESIPEVHLHNELADHEPDNKIHAIRTEGTNIWGEAMSNLPPDSFFFGSLRLFSDTCSTEFNVKHFPFDRYDLRRLSSSYVTTNHLYIMLVAKTFI